MCNADVQLKLQSVFIHGTFFLICITSSWPIMIMQNEKMHQYDDAGQFIVNDIVTHVLCIIYGI